MLSYGAYEVVRTFFLNQDGTPSSSAGFWAWLLATGMFGLVIVAVNVAANWDLFRRHRDVEAV
jgi:hypothetical protein